MSRIAVPRAVLLVALAALAATDVPRPAAAALRPAAAAPSEVAVVTLAGRPAGAALRVRGREVARLFGPRARPRLEAAARRLAPLLPPPVRVTVVLRGGTARLMADSIVIVTVETPDAAREGIRPAALARRWARALDEALAIPAIAVAPSGVVLSSGGTAVVAVVAAVPGPIRLGPYDRAVAEVTAGDGTLRITGRRPGSTVIPIRLGPYRAQVVISVRPPAGTIPPAAEVIVTGDPAPPDLIREAVQRRLDEAVQRSPGATVELGPIAVTEPLTPESSTTVAVAVGIRSPYAGPVQGTVSVTVVNRPIALADPEVLLISNRPETITGNGRLFQETLTRGRSARLLYHHMNGTPSQARVLKVTLANGGPARARVHYLSGIAGPSPDPIHLGFASTARFLSALLAGRGYVVDVPPRGATTFTAYTLPPMALVSGLMQFQVIEGGPVDLTVHVRLPWLLDRTVTVDLGPWAFPHPRGTFARSVVEIVRELPAHEPALLADLGVTANLVDVRTGEPLVGDYGVLYRVRVRLTNPTGREVSTTLTATAAGGLARGLFLVDGTPVDAGLMRPGEDRPIAVFTLAPGSAREILLLTMPVAGSYYPVRLALRPR